MERRRPKTVKKTVKNRFDSGLSEARSDYLIAGRDPHRLQAIPLNSAEILIRSTVSHAQEDLERVRTAGGGRVDITVGSALDIFGGKLPYQAVVDWHKREQQRQGQH
jgi:hypothetical protein